MGDLPHFRMRKEALKSHPAQDGLSQTNVKSFLQIKYIRRRRIFT